MNHNLTEKDLLHVLEEVRVDLLHRQDTKGSEIFPKSQVIVNEVHQKICAFIAKVNDKATKQEQGDELIRIAVAAIWGIASLESGEME